MLDMGWQYVLVGALVGYAVVITLMYGAVLKDRKEGGCLRLVKNALLAHALMKARGGDRDDLNMNYKAFDGSRLPMFSGYSLTNACMSYIVDRGDLRRSPFYTQVMEEKASAIDRYLEKNLGTDEQAVKFFEEYIFAIRDGDKGVESGEGGQKIETAVQADMNIAKKEE